MAKIFSVRQFSLEPRVKPEDFEQDMRAEIAKAPDLPGWKVSLAKGDRGEQVGNYLFLWEIESAERRDEIAPSSGQPSEEGRRYIEATAALWKTMAWMVFTDYIVIAST